MSKTDNDVATLEALADFREAIGRRQVLTARHKTKTYRTGYRFIEGTCLAVLRPASLLELWQVAEIAVAHDLNIIMQAANTGLTGGSSPQEAYDHDIVIVSTNRLRGIKLVAGAEQVICFPGSSLHELERLLRPYGRDPHSVIGSSCLGASVMGGVCNNSGGALVERGPAYTEHSLYAQLDDAGELHLINELGFDLGDTPTEILTRLEASSFMAEKRSTRLASDHDYKDWVRDVEAPTPARYNADPRRLKDASGCAGKLIVFAVRLDTFPKNDREQTFFIGSQDADVFTRLRRTILSDFKVLPVSAEYMDQDTFAFTEDYGRDTVHLIRAVGTDRLPPLFKFKENFASRLDALPFLSGDVVERILQVIGRMLPNPVPKPIRGIAAANQHLLILKMKNDGIEEARRLLEAEWGAGVLDFHSCDAREASLVGLHRFAAAGAAVRYHTLKGSSVGDLLALDIALPRNTTKWQERLPDEIEAHVEKKLYYGHFMCQVFHQDYVLKRGTNAAQVKKDMLGLLEARGAKYPAEHNVGHLYEAEPQLREHYRDLDPRNQLNPGIGKDSKRRHYC